MLSKKQILKLEKAGGIFTNCDIQIDDIRDLPIPDELKQQMIIMAKAKNKISALLKQYENDVNTESMFKVGDCIRVINSGEIKTITRIDNHTHPICAGYSRYKPDEISLVCYVKKDIPVEYINVNITL